MGGRSQGGSEQCSPYSPHFVAALHEFEDRVCAALGVSIPNSKSSRGGGIKKERSAGSAAAGAGGWLLNTCVRERDLLNGGTEQGKFDVAFR